MKSACDNTCNNKEDRNKDVQVGLTYPEVYSRLNFETAIIIFFKKNGEVRLMLGTRNISTIRAMYNTTGNELGYQESRCSIKNGNVAVYDLMLADARCFSISRLVEVIWLGVLSDRASIYDAGKRFVEFEKEYNKTNFIKNGINSLDELDSM